MKSPYDKRSGSFKNLSKQTSDERLADLSREMQSQVEAAQLLERLAIRHAQRAMAYEIFPVTRGFMAMLVDLLMFRRAFQMSLRRAIEGEGGIAALLDMSKGTIYSRLEALGLSADDIRDQKKGIGELMAASRPLQSRIAELVALRRRYREELKKLTKPRGR